MERKHQRRERDNIDFYRGAKITLAGRIRKKLTEETTWYKQKRKRDDEEEKEDRSKEERSPAKRRGGGGLEATMPLVCVEVNEEDQHQEEENLSAIAVLFVPFTGGQSWQRESGAMRQLPRSHPDGSSRWWRGQGTA